VNDIGVLYLASTEFEKLLKMDSRLREAFLLGNHDFSSETTAAELP